MRRLDGLGMAIMTGVVLALTVGCSAPAGSASAAATAGPAATTAGPAAAMTGPTSSVSSATTGPGTGPESAALMGAVPDQLQFTATTLDGAAFSGSSLAGSPAVLWFWAPWCPNCRAEAPQIAAAAAATEGVVTFVGVAAQDDLGPMRSFVDNYGVGGFEHLADLDAVIWQRFGVTLQPAYAFIGDDGSVEVVKSRMSESELAVKLAELTASSG